MDVYLGRKRVTLDPTRSLGKGGEAEVFDLGGGRALKLYKAPDHPDYQGLPDEQRAAEERIAAHQTKLRAFPTGLPRQVVAPGALATDRRGQRIVGYEMALVTPAEPLLRYADPVFRRAGVAGATVVTLFRQLWVAVDALHTAGVVIGDFNDVNVLVTAGSLSPHSRAGSIRGPHALPAHPRACGATANAEPRLIDADSFQFGPYACRVFSERFVDPLLCAPDAPAPRLSRPYGPDADWYAFAVLLMQSLLFVGPYGGIYRPKAPSQRMPHGARPLHRITVFHPEVQYPKPATSPRVLPDDLLQHFHRLFQADQRGPFPARLLEQLRFVTCPRCGVEHARAACPTCEPTQATRPRQVMSVRGDVACKRIFETSGVILHAAVERGRLRFVYHQDGAYRREDGAVLLGGALDATLPRLRFGIQGERTLAAQGGALVVLQPGLPPERIAVDADGAGGPAFAANARHRYWTAGGRLLRDAAPAWAGAPAIEPIGDVLAGQTRIWVGPTFGLGFYRASAVSVAFTFDGERRGINDTLRLPPLPGQLVDAACVLDEGRAWLLLALEARGRTRHLCVVCSRAGVVEATAEAPAGDGGWLGTLGGKHAVAGMLLGATDDGVARIEIDGAGGLHRSRDFPATEPFVDSASHLLAGEDGLYVVGRRDIVALKIA